MASIRHSPCGWTKTSGKRACGRDSCRPAFQAVRQEVSGMLCCPAFRIGRGMLVPRRIGGCTHGSGVSAFDVELVSEVAAGFALDRREAVVLGGAFEQQAGGGLVARARLAQHDQRGDEKGGNGRGMHGGVPQAVATKDWPGCHSQAVSSPLCRACSRRSVSRAERPTLRLLAAMLITRPSGLTMKVARTATPLSACMPKPCTRLREASPSMGNFTAPSPCRTQARWACAESTLAPSRTAPDRSKSWLRSE